MLLAVKRYRCTGCAALSNPVEALDTPTPDTINLEIVRLKKY